MYVYLPKFHIHNAYNILLFVKTAKKGRRRRRMHTGDYDMVNYSFIIIISRSGSCGRKGREKPAITTFALCSIIWWYCITTTLYTTYILNTHLSPFSQMRILSTFFVHNFLSIYHQEFQTTEIDTSDRIVCTCVCMYIYTTQITQQFKWKFFYIEYQKTCLFFWNIVWIVSLCHNHSVCMLW